MTEQDALASVVRRIEPAQVAEGMVTTFRAGISGYALTKGRRTLGIRPRDGRWALPYDEREDITPA